MHAANEELKLSSSKESLGLEKTGGVQSPEKRGLL